MSINKSKKTIGAFKSIAFSLTFLIIFSLILEMTARFAGIKTELSVKKLPNQKNHLIFHWLQTREALQRDPKASFLIVALGDSVTYGLEVDYDKIFCNVLEKKINTEFPQMNCQVISAGVPSYTSFRGLILLEKEILVLKPQIVIISFGLNDSYTSGRLSDRQVYARTHGFRAEFKKIFAYSAFYSGLERAWQQVLSRFDGYEKSLPKNSPNIRARVPLDEYADNLTRMTESATKNGALKVIFLKEFVAGGCDGFDLVRFSDYMQVMEKTAHQTGQLLIDPTPAFENAVSAGERLPQAQIEEITKTQIKGLYFTRPEFKELFVDPWHPNAKGHEIIADLLFDTIKEGGFFP